MSSYAEEVAATLAHADSLEFSPGDLQLADSLLRLFLYPTMELTAQRGSEIRLVRNWPKQYKENVRIQFRQAARTLPLDQLPTYVAGFIRDRFAHPAFTPFRHGMQTCIIGGSLIPDGSTKWGELKVALREDLASWRGRRSASDRDEYDALVRDLITVHADRSVKRLLTRISTKQQLLSAVCSVAHTADGVLLDLHPGSYTNHFLQIYRDAMGVDCVLDSIILLYRESVDKLKAAYEGGTMYWQSQ
ncbi:hypothetical protein EXIGLDRAFT_765063 [Exidia glandulosa HHB12029]|uniref:Uncharacterized protein n=1 Tax=Exidia glandulosa HHB12029 TaxID=1314781 RepID=A0A165KSX7_EXIGL|nr:hypothetical protein EXIGLDRAFT_765063 [Exidia glandulosa HHB12029]